MKALLLFIALTLTGTAAAADGSRSGYRLTEKHVIGGNAGWDYITVDSDARRVYVTHFRSVEVLDADSGAVVGRIADMNGARGVSIVPAVGKGYATNGKTDSVIVFDLKTLARVGEIPVGKKPDSTIYDAGTDRVLVNNGDGDSMSVIDPRTDRVVATIPLGGGPEFLAADGKGTVWTNLFDQASFVTVDLRSGQALRTTPIDGCKGASSMAFDAAHRRLFIGCHSKKLFVVDPDSGKVIQSMPIGEHSDAVIYDAQRGLVFASTGDGFVTIVRQESADRYVVVDHVKTMRAAKTLGLDTRTGKLFSATVEGAPEGATSQPAPLGKVAYEHGPFVVIEVAPDFDVAALPAYRWKPGPTYERGKHCHGEVCDGEWGVIRIHGTELTQHLVHLWQDHFLKLHPNIRYQDYFVPSGFAGITVGTADINVMGHTAWRSDLKAFEGVHGYPPLEIMFATGGFNLGKGNTPGVVFFVNRDNPIAGLTLDQLDGILGAERTGGWNGSTWSTAAERGPEKNIRTWGQLGLTGAWADQPIHIYGIDATLSNWSDLIQRVVFKGGDKWNPAIEEMVRGGSKAPADVQIVQAVAGDRYGIGFNLMRVVEKEPRVRSIAVASDKARAFIAPTRESMYRRTYPLSNAVYIYIDRPPGQAISPRLKEFLAYILSREGQQDVVDDGMYLPLNPDAARQQRDKLQ